MSYGPDPTWHLKRYSVVQCQKADLMRAALERITKLPPNQSAQEIAQATLLLERNIKEE